MVSAKPHIVKSPHDDSIIEVNWSPPFEGPTQLPPHLNHEQQKDLMDTYILAYQAMECLLDTCAPPCTLLPTDLESKLRSHALKYTWQYKLNEGEIVVFNNQRMLHGRQSFSLAKGHNKHRHLIGCYTDAMDTLSHYRKLLRQQEEKSQTIMKHAGNGTRALSVH